MGPFTCISRIKSLSLQVFLTIHKGHSYLVTKMKREELVYLLYIILFSLYVIAVHSSSGGLEREREGLTRFFMASDVDLKLTMEGNTNYSSLRNKFSPNIQLENTSLCSKYRGERGGNSSFESISTDSFLLLWVVKSKASNFDARKSIRTTWGRNSILPTIQTRIVFILGTVPNNDQLQVRIDREFSINGDLVQGDFVDAYLNNTIKLKVGFSWATTHCPNAQFFAFVDDDFFIPTYNVLSLFQNVQEMASEDFILGYVVYRGRPIREKTGKHYIAYKDYPYKSYPKYPIAGLFFLPMQTAKKISIGLTYAKDIKFDDVLLGYICERLGIPMIRSTNILGGGRFPGMKCIYSTFLGYHSVKDPKEMKRLWQMYNHLRRNSVWHHGEETFLDSWLLYIKCALGI